MPRKKVAVRGSADDSLSLEILANRMKQLESILNAQAAEVALLKGENEELRQLHRQALEEKRKAEEGLQAALSELQKLREAVPLDQRTRQALLASIAVEAQQDFESRQAETEKAVRNASLVEIENPSEHAIELGLNGVFVIIPPGRARIPAPFLPLWRDYCTAVQYARERDSVIANRQVPFNVMEMWRVEG
jgi:hypothetical protein